LWQSLTNSRIMWNNRDGSISKLGIDYGESSMSKHRAYTRQQIRYDWKYSICNIKTYKTQVVVVQRLLPAERCTNATRSSTFVLATNNAYIHVFFFLRMRTKSLIFCLNSTLFPSASTHLSHDGHSIEVMLTVTRKCQAQLEQLAFHTVCWYSERKRIVQRDKVICNNLYCYNNNINFQFSLIYTSDTYGMWIFLT